MKILYEDIFHWMKYIYEDILFIVAAHAVGITMTEDMIEAMMIETTTADHTGKLTIVDLSCQKFGGRYQSLLNPNLRHGP